MTTDTVQKGYRLPLEIAKRIEEARRRASEAAGVPVSETAIVTRLLELGLAVLEKKRSK